MTVWLEVEGKQLRVELPAASGPGLVCSVDGRELVVDACMLEAGVLSVVVEGRQYRCLLDGDAVLVAGRRIAFSRFDPRSLAARRGVADGADGPRAIKAPMPGRVVRIAVAAGEAVEQGAAVVVIEAMKMQNELKSPKSGTVARIAVSVGDTVGVGDVLAVIE
ncbi:biotin carboxyl carrier protein [Granulicella pectinivorans]|jgi:biotin carboxyl carrier protein|uniref:Biotin carboxyl carrier protein n=1 Tax=Granulicella pectinivorans TaxID=474950 RepID=A0A1I6L1B1_9BACT|nr:acetyl-CoA carboxylase biotin carboxyl carrier protein subunit [Granulicella pectinivorans]SFR97259.1 biotin carboxyl carrier protein [Granulicella pectinivorans]